MGTGNRRHLPFGFFCKCKGVAKFELDVLKIPAWSSSIQAFFPGPCFSADRWQALYWQGRSPGFVSMWCTTPCLTVAALKSCESSSGYSFSKNLANFGCHACCSFAFGVSALSVNLVLAAPGQHFVGTPCSPPPCPSQLCDSC